MPHARSLVRLFRRAVPGVLLLLLLLAPRAAHAGSRAEAPIARRPFVVDVNGRWIGHGVAYGPHRDGQSPDGAQPSPAELEADLRQIAAHWPLLRMYGSRGATEEVLRIVRRTGLDLHVVVGAWLAPEERRDSTGAIVQRFPAAVAANRAELETAIRLANRHPGIVSAIAVGNETQVSWSDHRVPTALLLAELREARRRTRVPVTTADDFNFWNKPESVPVAAVVDFIFLHAHPLWNGCQLENAIDWTDRTVGSIRDAHPGVPIVLGETGWATSVGHEGDQGKLIHGRVGEEEQSAFLDSITAWVARTHTPTLVFEAYDENWKGGPHTEDVEKHWGFFHADRTPKRAMQPRR